MEVEVAVWRGVCRIRGVHERACIARSLFGVRTDTMVGHVVWISVRYLNMFMYSMLVSVRTREGPARSWRARGGSTLLERTTCVRSEVTALHVFVVLVDSFPSAVLTTLRIAKGRYGTREVILQDLASNALKGNVLS